MQRSLIYFYFRVFKKCILCWISSFKLCIVPVTLYSSVPLLPLALRTEASALKVTQKASCPSSPLLTGFSSLSRSSSESIFCFFTGFSDSPCMCLPSSLLPTVFFRSCLVALGSHLWQSVDFHLMNFLRTTCSIACSHLPANAVVFLLICPSLLEAQTIPVGVNDTF